MTKEEREEAIKQLQGCIIAEEHGKDGKPNGNVTCELTKDILDMAIKALEQEPCDNAVSRQAVIDIVDSYSDSQSNVEDVTQDIISYVVALPPVNPQPKTGHWEWVQYDYNPKIGNWHCSECRSVVVECVSKEEKGGIPLYKYCPQCGAKMSEIPTGSDPQESEKVN